MVGTRIGVGLVVALLSVGLAGSPAGARGGGAACRKLCKAVVSCKGLRGQARRACRQRLREAVLECKASQPPVCLASPSGAFLARDS